MHALTSHRQPDTAAAARAPEWPASVFVALVFAGAIWTRLAPLIMVGALLYVFMMPRQPGAGRSVAASRDGVTAWIGGHIGLVLSVAFSLLAMAAAFWSPDPVEGLSKAAVLAALTVGGFWIVARAHAIAPPVLRHALRACVIAYGVAAAVTAVELAQGAPMSTWLQAQAIEVFGTSDAQGRLRVQTVYWNRNITTLTVLFFPMLLVALGAFRGPILRTTAVVWLTAAVGVAVTSSIKETGLVALVAGVAATIGALALTGFARHVMLLGWTIAALAVPPVITALEPHELWRAPAIQHSGRARLTIWRGYSAALAESDPFGVGTHGSETGDGPYLTHDYILPSDPRPFRDAMGQPFEPVHPHNSPLQVRYELGIAGAVLLWLTGAAAITRMSAGSRIVAALALGHAAAMTVTLSLTHALWQEWYLGALAASLTFLAFGRQLSAVKD